MTLEELYQIGIVRDTTLVRIIEPLSRIYEITHTGRGCDPEIRKYGGRTFDGLRWSRRFDEVTVRLAENWEDEE